MQGVARRASGCLGLIRLLLLVDLDLQSSRYPRPRCAMLIRGLQACLGDPAHDAAKAACPACHVTGRRSPRRIGFSSLASPSLGISVHRPLAQQGRLHTLLVVGLVACMAPEELWQGEGLGFRAEGFGFRV